MTPASRRAYVGVASNDVPLASIAAGLVALRRQFGALECSKTVESTALNGHGPGYLNLVVQFSTVLNWSQLRAQLKSIEHACGRRRGDAAATAVKLDLDLLILSGPTGSPDESDLPLAELCVASYVLAPLAELLPHWRHPENSIALAELRATTRSNAHQLKCVPDAPWNATRPDVQVNVA